MRDVPAAVDAAIDSLEQHVRLKVTVDWDGDGHADGVTTADFADTLGNSWGFTSDGHRFLTTGVTGTISAHDAYTTGGAAVHAVPAANAYRISYLNTISRKNVRVTVTGNTCPLPTGAGLEPVNLVLRMLTLGDYYMIRVVVATSGAVTLSAHRDATSVTDVSLGSAAVASYTHAAATPFSITGEVEDVTGGVRLRARIWQGATEPDTWHLSITDTDAARYTNYGWIGVRDGVATGNTNTNPRLFTHDRVVITNLSNTIDDISDKLADLEIERDFSGSLPDEVLVVEGIAAATASGSLVVGLSDAEAAANPALDASLRLNAVRYWSRFNASSPLYGKPRANRSVNVSVEHLTTDGWLATPRLTNAVMRALPVNVGDVTADLDLIDVRDRMRTNVSLPVVYANTPVDLTTPTPRKPGLEATWVASHCLWQAGYSLSPTWSATRTVVAVPFHGSGAQFTGKEYIGTPIAMLVPDSLDYNKALPMEFDDGPFSLALARCDTGWRHRAIYHPATAKSAMFFTFGHSVGRVELWIKPRTSPIDEPFRLYFNTYGGSIEWSATFHMTTAGQLVLTLVNGAVTRTVNGPTITPDDQWHQVGVDWSDYTGVALFNADTVITSTAFTVTPDASGGTSTWSLTTDFHDPAAELVASTGNTVLSPWQPYTWPTRAVCDRLQNHALMGIVPADDDKVWDVLAELVQAERGLLFADVDGIPNIWSRARLNAADALTPVRTITARQHLSDLKYNDSRDMIRNRVTVPYQPVSITLGKDLWTLETSTYLPALTAITIPVSFAASVAAGQSNTSPGSGILVEGWATANSDGTGFQVNFGSLFPTAGIDVVVTQITGTTANIEIRNRYYIGFWLLEVGGEPALVVRGDAIEQTEAATPPTVSDAASIAAYGETPLTVDANRWVQTDAFARGAANHLLALLRDEQVVFDDLTIPGDPRLESWDCVQLEDPTGLVIDTPLTVEGINDRFPGIGYDTGLVARPQRGQWILGGAGVGTPIGDGILGGTP